MGQNQHNDAYPVGAHVDDSGLVGVRLHTPHLVDAGTFSPCPVIPPAEFVAAHGPLAVQTIHGMGDYIGHYRLEPGAYGDWLRGCIDPLTRNGYESEIEAAIVRDVVATYHAATLRALLRAAS